MRDRLFRVVLLAGLLVFAALPAANAQTGSSASNATGSERPLYLDIVGTSTSQAILPDDLIEAMAREVLSQSGQAVLSVDDDNLPAGVRVLRIMVLVSETQDSTGATIAAAATTSLLRTPAEDSGDASTRSFYQGMQQEMATGPDEDSAETALRARFKTELQARIRAAISAGSAHATPQ
ncbi:hypothetical protein [Salinisphaera hydrothermalis]|uniref:Lipoprotein n=1 Tax=Salinisphaera hydrothermalis (strain C41B8) TaxID=1304275 RepID=A0A084ILL7_SALHC|nr:hypothetical protein [Salinisphaera hydrothermalis]KEZ77601.1 hypothetical protein C41B8_09491 [Salinisphaera hydrothermalis C41B8]